ncbi:MAG: S41 family peptidase [Chloroflexi bacterium]|nr:S41 family peptidase [Chloroflexota bacterium]
MPRIAFGSLALLVLLASVVAMVVGCGGSADAETEAETVEGLPPEFVKLAEVWALLQERHIEPEGIDPQAAVDGAIRGMMDSIDDPHAGYLDSDQYSMMRQDIQGYFEGIGAEVGVRNGLITIIAPIPDTPADEAGILSRDVILEIDGESTQGLELFEVINRIRGEKGTTVRLLVRRDRTGETIEIEIERGVIPLESVRLTMLVGRIGHLRITSFSGTSKEELETALARFERSQGLGLVVDIRNNPGGLVSSVVEVTSQFVDEGLVLYQLDGKGHRRDWNAESGGVALEVPMVVLMNNGSASASEVFAGAIMHHGRAETIGETTFGKGSVNNLWPLFDGSAVNFTIGRWYTPSGQLIEGQGITPDIIQEAPENDDEDIQLDFAIERLKELIES